VRSLSPSLPPTSNLNGCDTYEELKWFKGSPVWMLYLLNQRLQIQFRFDLTNHFRATANSISVLCFSQQPGITCLHVSRQGGIDSTQWMRTLNSVSRMAGSEVTLNPLNFMYTWHPSLYPILFCLYLHNPSFSLGRKSHLRFDPMMQTRGVSYITVHVLSMDSERLESGVCPK